MSDEFAPTSYAELADVIWCLPLLIREARRARGLSLRAAARDAGMNFSTLTRIEAGEDARGTNLVAVLRWLDTPPHTAKAARNAEQATTTEGETA